MATTEHYDFWYLDPDEEISDFPNTWDFNIDKLDAAIHEAATDNVTVGRVPNLPASKTTSGEFAQARIPNLPASKTTSGTFADARIPDSIARTSDLDDETAALNDRIDTNKTDLESLGKRVDTTETDIKDHDKRLDDLEDNQGDGSGGSSYRNEKVDAEVGQGTFSITRDGPVVFIAGGVTVDSGVSPGTAIFEVPEWAQGDDVSIMPCIATKDDDEYITTHLMVSGSKTVATADIADGSYVFGSSTYLTTKDMGDEDE